MFCHSCGTQVADDVKFCPNCGQSLSIPPVSGGAAAPPLAVPPAVPWTPPVGITAQPGRWISEGWNLVTADLGNYIVISLIFFLLNGVPFIQGALICGFHIFTMKKLMGRPAELGDLFKGFNFFIHALVASLLIGIFVFCGTLLCIIPGLVIAAMYKFTFLFIVDKRMEFWPAMQASHAVAKNDYFGFTMFLLLAFLVNVLGFLCLFVGLLVTIPATFAAITIAYKEIVGFDPRTPDVI
jgi:uncharacterized membrane protein